MDLSVQHDPPAGGQSNRLPALPGDLNLTLRMYWPEQSAIDGTGKLLCGQQGLSQAYYRHRYLDIAGHHGRDLRTRHDGGNPVHHFHALGINTTLRGQDAIRNLYRTWPQTGECVMYTDDEKIAVGGNMIASMMTGYQFKPGKAHARARDPAPLGVRCGYGREGARR